MSEIAQAAADATGRSRIREAVAIFDDYDDLLDAIDELEVAGFDRAQIKLMLSCGSAERKLGHPIEDVRELEDEPAVALGGWVDRYELAECKAALTTGLAYVGSLAAIGVVVAGGGELAAIIGAAAVAGGTAGALGLWLVRLVGRCRTRKINEQLSRGGLLLWAEARSCQQERRAIRILECHATRDVHLHEMTADF